MNWVPGVIICLVTMLLLYGWFRWCPLTRSRLPVVPIISPPIAIRKTRLAPPPEVAKVTQMPAESPKSLGPHYTKSLKLLLSGPLGIAEKKDVVRYRALQAMGLVDGVGVRCVSLTKAGRNLLRTGELTPLPASKVDSDFEIYLNGTRVTSMRAVTFDPAPEFPF